MILDSFLKGLHSERKLDFSGILFTSDRRGRVKDTDVLLISVLSNGRDID